MKIGVPPLNILISTFYILFTGVVAYWLKLSHKKQIKIEERSSSSAQIQSIKKQLNWNKIFAKSWIKKYTLLGACLNENRKYLINEAFILSIYAVTCLKINKIILWPVAFITFLLPLSFALTEVAVRYLQGYLRKEQNKEKKANTKAINNVNQDDIQIEAVNIESPNVKVEVIKNQQIHKMEEKSIVQILCVSLFAFITFVLFYQTIFTLTNSISNSGQLNITSLIIIMVIDQLAVRVSVGLLTFSILKLLQHYNVLQFKQNSVFNWICHQQITKESIQLYKQLIQRREVEKTSSPLQGMEATHNFIRPQLHKPESVSSDNQCLNFLNLQPETHSQQNNQEDPLERQVYLTTPQKQLFQGNEKQQEMANQKQQQQEEQQNKSILHTLIDNKQNQTINNEFNKSTLKSHEQSKGLDDIMTSKDDNIGDAQNFKADFHLENSRYDTKGVRKNKKRPAKRVLKLTGNSPYLQYLPNMLKNIDKVKNVQKEKKML